MNERNAVVQIMAESLKTRPNSLRGEGAGADPRLVAVLEYRMQRKALAKTAAGILARFADAAA